MAVEVGRTRRLFTVDQYARMVEVGILTKYDRVELIHGEIVEKMPIGRGHFAAVSALHELFSERLGRRVIIGTSGSLRVPPRSMPEPDLMLLVRRADFYREADLRPEDVLLLVEVADTSLRYDREVKGPLYAAAGVPEYWIVDVDGGAVEIYRDPAAGGYQRAQRVVRGTSFGPQAFPDLVVSVSDILG
jgi:Uma2 family endonuclease